MNSDENQTYIATETRALGLRQLWVKHEIRRLITWKQRTRGSRWLAKVSISEVPFSLFKHHRIYLRRTIFENEGSCW